MDMYPLVAEADFGVAAVKTDEFDTETPIAILIADFVSETTTFCLVIFGLVLNSKLTAKNKPTSHFSIHNIKFYNVLLDYAHQNQKQSNPIVEIKSFLQRNTFRFQKVSEETEDMHSTLFKNRVTWSRVRKQRI